MAWSYSGDPSSSTRDSIRFLCGDTDTNDQLLSDEEVDYLADQVSASGSTAATYRAAHRCLLAIASKFSRLADQSTGDLRVAMSQKASNAREQAALLLKIADDDNLTVPTPYAGGISWADKQIDRDNPDRVDPYFESGQFANTNDPGSGPSRNVVDADNTRWDYQR